MGQCQILFFSEVLDECMVFNSGILMGVSAGPAASVVAVCLACDFDMNGHIVILNAAHRKTDKRQEYFDMLTVTLNWRITHCFFAKGMTG